MFSAATRCHQVWEYIYEQFIIWTVFQTAGHTYVKAVVITCQEKFPTAHSLEKIQVSPAAFANPARFLYLVSSCHRACKTHRKPKDHRSLLCPFLVNLLPTVKTLGYNSVFIPTVTPAQSRMRSMKSTGSVAHVPKHLLCTARVFISLWSFLSKGVSCFLKL